MCRPPPHPDPLPPQRVEREGPAPKAWEGEVGAGKRCGIRHLTPTLSAPKGGEGEEGRSLPIAGMDDNGPGLRHFAPARRHKAKAPGSIMLPPICLAPAKISGTILPGGLFILCPRAPGAGGEAEVVEPTSRRSKPDRPTFPAVAATAALTAVR